MMNPTKQQYSEPFPRGCLIQDRYKVICELGRGGMGTVYRVEQVLLQQEMALKTIVPEKATDKGLLRFQQEARALNRLDHPGLVKVHDFGLYRDQPFFVMDLVRGRSLADHVAQSGPLDLDWCLHLFIQIAFALGYAHDNGVIHRDLKPGNVMIVDGVSHGEQAIKLVDFGIAKLTQGDDEVHALTKTGEVFGSPLYMSPEQCMGIAVDHRTDIYSYGCVMYEALTGMAPFTAESPVAIMMKHQSETPLSLKEASLGRQFPQSVESLVERLLRKNPNDRYQSFKAVAGDLNKLLAGLSIDRSANRAVTTASSTARKLQNNSEDQSHRRSKVVPNLALLAPLAVATLACGFFLGRQSSPPSVVHVKEFVPLELQVPLVEPINLTKPITPIDADVKRFYDSMKRGKQSYSSIVGNMRVFSFPNFTIGLLRWADPLHSRPQETEAVNRVRIPAAAGICFLMDDTCINHPELLEFFRGDEFNAIGFSNSFSTVMSSVSGASISVSTDVFKRLGRFKFSTLRLDGVRLDDESAAAIGELKEITSIRANTAGSVTSHQCAIFMQSLPKLAMLNVSNNEGVLNDLPDEVLRNSNVSRFNAGNTNASERALAKLHSMAKLNDLDLSKSNISEKGLRAIINIPNLSTLTLDSAQVFEKPELFKEFSHLRGLGMRGVRWSDANFAKLQKICAQKHIYLILGPDLSVQNKVAIENKMKNAMDETGMGAGSSFAPIGKVK